MSETKASVILLYSTHLEAGFTRTGLPAGDGNSQSEHKVAPEPDICSESRRPSVKTAPRSVLLG